MLKRFLIIAAAAIGTSISASAQFQGNVFVEDSSIRAFAGGIQKQLAWSGGMDNPQFAMGDLNHDGKKDLVIYEPWTANTVRVFLNNGTPGQVSYTYAPKFAAPFNSLSPVIISDYLKLEDYNRDGIPDLITKGTGGFNIYRGSYVDDMIHFTYYKELRYNSPAGTINCYSQPTDIPAVVDVDGDGDLDFFGYYEDGSILYFFKNCQVEHNSPADSIDICKPSNCWGHFNQGYDRTFVLGTATGSSGCPTFFNYGCKGTLHQGNAICMLDMDGDGDMDMLDGNISFKDIQYVVNGRAQYGGTDSIIAQDTTWQRNGVAVNMPYWPAAFHVDVNGDGLKDILVSPHAQSISENYKCVAYYKNTGSVNIPNFVYQNDTLLIDQMLDHGSNSYPVLYDYDKDGRPDLFVGSTGYYKTGGIFRSRISYYRNVTSGNNTQFELQTSDFLDLSAANVEGAYPAFGDLDNDGKDDLVIGHADGTLTFYHNFAIAVGDPPLWQLPATLRDGAGAVINPTAFVAPVIYDIDKDNKPDLLMTGEVGTVTLYKNASTAAGALNLTHVTDTLGGMQADVNRYTYGTMYIGHMDNTGKDYIVLGTAAGTLRRYQGFETGNVNVPYQLVDTAYSNLRLPGRSAVTFGDVDRDGMFEMIGGNTLGGLQQFKQVLRVNANVGLGTIHNAGVCSIYPNPASDVLYINWDAAFAAQQKVRIQLFNMTGQEVAANEVAGAKGIGTLALSNLPAGIYICLLRAGDNVYTQPVSIRK